MKCPVCANEEGFQELSPALCRANNLLCPRCGLVFIPRSADEKHDYYRQDGYYTESPNLSARPLLTSRHLLLGLARERVERMDELLGTRISGRRVLDIGCGYGEILGYLRLRRDCEVLGMEASVRAAKVGSELFGVRIVPALLEDQQAGEGTFDLVICNHTLEHVDDPARFLALLKQRMKPDGLLYLEVPNVLWPSGGFTLDAFLYDEHLQTFSSWNLHLLLRQCGLAARAYSDRDFLRFVCAIAPSPRDVDVPPIAADRVSTFLHDYKENYSLAQHLRVYAGKARYLARLSYSKLVDMVQQP